MNWIVGSSRPGQRQEPPCRARGRWVTDGGSASFRGPRGKSQVALKIIRNVGKYREAARLEINVLKKIKEKDKENKL